MAKALFANYVKDTLNGGISNVDTTITVNSGTLWPTITGSDYFYATIVDAATGNVIEVVKVTAHAAASSTLTVTRGQQGTAGTAFINGDKIELRATKANFEELQITVNGIVKGDGTGTVSAASAGTDYLAPPSGTSILKANSGGALANATAGTDYLTLTKPSSQSVLFAHQQFQGL